MPLSVTTTVRTPTTPRPADEELPWSLFEQPWWLDAVAPGAWTEVLVRDDAGVAGRLVTCERRRAGVRVVAPPLLTPHQGPWLRPVDGAPAHSLARHMDVLGQLIDQAPTGVVTRARLDPTTPSVLPWLWRGFTATWRYTYEIPAGRDERTSWGMLRQRPRRAIRRADDRLGFRAAAPGEVERLVNDRLTRTGERPLPPGLVGRLDAALAPRGLRDAIAAVDDRDRAVAVAYFVHDHDATYYLLGGRRDDVPDHGAPSGLIWRGMGLARERGVRFDFEGSMLPPIEAFFRSFGAVPRAYAEVLRASRPVRAGLVLTGYGGA